VSDGPIFVVALRLSINRASASEHIEGHRAWIKRGLEDGVFLVVGNLEPGAGGAIIAHGVTAEQLRARVEEDPFVAAGVVDAELTEITPTQADERLGFLFG